MGPKAISLCAGLVGGVLLTLAVQYALEKPVQAPRAAPPDPLITKLLADQAEGERRVADATERARAAEAELAAREAANEAATRELEELRRRLAPKEVAGAEAPRPTAPPTGEELLKGVGEFGSALGQVIQGQGEEAKAKLRELFARGGQAAVDLLVGKFEDPATEIGLRVAIAHALAQSGNEEAIAALKAVLADPAEEDMIKLRLASHGLAFTDAEGVEPALLDAAHRAADTGVRANAAFGLARRRSPEGLALYVKATDEAMANRDPAALQYLGGSCSSATRRCRRCGSGCSRTRSRRRS
jgi:hypothetical protein